MITRGVFGVVGAPGGRRGRPVRMFPRVASGTAQAAAQWAQELEAELADCPDERAEILIEAGESWHQAGDHDRAISLFSEAISLGGEDAGSARVALAEVLFALDRA